MTETSLQTNAWFPYECYDHRDRKKKIRVQRSQRSNGNALVCYCSDGSDCDHFNRLKNSISAILAITVTEIPQMAFALADIQITLYRSLNFGFCSDNSSIFFRDRSDHMETRHIKGDSSKSIHLKTRYVESHSFIFQCLHEKYTLSFLFITNVTKI